jgi:hypothetical protein
MKSPKYTDKRRRYRTAAESSQPGYLAKRLKAYARLERITAKKSLLDAIVADGKVSIRVFRRVK